MKKFLLILLFLSLVAHAKEKNEPIDIIQSASYCFDTEKLFQQLKEEYKEYPLIYGKAGDTVESTFTLWVQPTQKSWTLVVTKDKVSCVLGAGEDLRIIKLNKPGSI